jgi:Cu/Ag efflux protein CusF
VLTYVHVYFHLGLANRHPEKKDVRFSEAAGQPTVVGVGKVIAVVPNARQIVVDHKEIKGFMGAMTMGYKVTPPTLLNGFKAGEPIRFTIDTQQKAIIKIEKLQP